MNGSFLNQLLLNTMQQLILSPRISAPTTSTIMEYMVVFCIAEASSRWSCSTGALHGLFDLVLVHQITCLYVQLARQNVGLNILLQQGT